jgi:hypothetical protein
MRALLLCAAAAYAATTNERLVDPVSLEMARADEKRYRENYSPRTPKELAEDERALQFYTKIMSQVTNWATDDHKPRPPSPAPLPPSVRLTLHASSPSARRSALRIVKELRGQRAARTAVLVQTPYWGSGSKEDERERFQDELWSVAEAAGLERRNTALGTSSTPSRTSRVTESLITELDEGTSEASAQIIVSIDLDAWTPCRTFSKDFWDALPSLEGDDLYIAAAPPVKPGHAAVADLSTTVIGWASPEGNQRAKELADVLRDYRDKQLTGPGSSESPPDSVLDAAYDLDVEPSDLPPQLRCASCSAGCAGADLEKERNKVRAGTPERLVKFEEDTSKIDALAARILGDEGDRRLPCMHGYETTQEPLKPSFVIVSGVNVREGNNAKADVDLALNKRAYALARGYGFAFYVADTFDRLLRRKTAHRSNFEEKRLAWEFSKILMVRDAMRRYRSARWYCWIDADAWVNPTRFSVELERFVEDVPSDRHVVLGNYRGLNTGVFLVRGNADGREVVRKWLAVARDGLAQCHPHDQAALEWLQLWAMNGSHVGQRRPYDFECTKRSACGAGGAGYSCIPLWGEAVKRAHQWSSPSISAYQSQTWYVDEAVDRGIANPETPLFWISTETERRPRLQCFRCYSSLDNVDYRPGRNFKVAPGADSSWLVNHKGQLLFYKTAMTIGKQAGDACLVEPQTRIYFQV